MCGRFTLRSPAADWSQLFLPSMHAEDPGWDDPPRYNIAPTQPIVCILREGTGGGRQVAKYRWGLVPPWSADLKIGNRMINARSETLDSKPSFKNSFASRRCLIPIDGYYEWQKRPDGKQPYLIEPANGRVHLVAGLWEENRKVDAAQPIRTCTIITTSANQLTGEVHDRMPVFLEEQDHDRWLDPGYRDVPALKELLHPADESLLRMTPVSQYVNSPRSDDERCVAPLE
ncbi:MAG: SOS response-associated peptidase [Rubripirellula sp.]